MLLKRDVMRLPTAVEVNYAVSGESHVVGVTTSSRQSGKSVYAAIVYTEKRMARPKDFPDLYSY
jgi:hypothetical protein